MSYDGPERRKMDRDWVERDRLLTETNTLMNGLKSTVENYIIEDKAEHKSIKNRVFYLTMAVVVIGVVLGGPSFAMMFIK